MVSKYLKAIADTEQKAISSEYTHRTALENFFNEIKNNNSIQIHQESRDNNTADKPDFRVSRESITLGYVETKKIGADLDKEVTSNQLERYYALSDNILLTDYLRFIWIYNREIKADIRLCEKVNLAKSIKLNETKTAELTDLLEKFFNQNVAHICNATELAQKLATPTKYIKDAIINRLKDENEKLVSLHKLFKENINSELTTDEFADAFAQTMTYSMFLARLNTNEPLTVDNLKRVMPTSFMLIKELLGFLSIIHEFTEISPYLDRILFIINHINLEEINKSLQINKEADNDPYIHFYEDFLNAYDKDLQILSGSYYTPRPVVQGIINIIDETLSSDFALDSGFGNNSVRVLDFACGTGTFLYEIFDKILSRVSTPAKKSLIENHLLKNMFGFEFMMAPYVVSHLKLSSFLQEHGKELKNEDERIKVYFTNTLEDINADRNITLEGFFPAIAKEGKTAQAIKEDKSILVITGNPPYNVKSKNSLEGDLKDFHDGYKPSNEINLNSLSDDYIKFIAFAHNKIEKAGKGVVGVITNNSFYRGITHRRMRGKLLKTFDKIYIIDLHGSGGKQDENVFDIKQEVGITIMVKNDKIPEAERGVFYREMLGSRAEKFKQLAKIDFKTIPKLEIKEFNQRFNESRWSERFEYDSLNKLKKKGSLNFFYPIHKNKTIEEYAEFIGLGEIFEKYITGIQTEADKLTISFSKEMVIEKIALLKNGSNEEILKLADKTNDSDWNVAKAKADVDDYNEDNIKPISYKPFDTRYTYYTGRMGLIARPRPEIMPHMVSGANMGLCFVRFDNRELGTYSFIVNTLVDRHILDVKGDSMVVAPLYIYPETSKRHLSFNDQPKPNFKANFTAHYQKFYPNATPEQILAYIYAVMYCPTYRSTYIDLLKIDFPRIPFNFSLPKMEELASLGQKLINIHLLKDIPNISIGLAKFYSEHDYTCQYSKYNSSTGEVFINESLCFTGLSQDIWDFKIGGYQVIDKYLKSRKGLDITNNIEHIEKIIKVIEQTIILMEQIDKAYNNS